MLLQKHEEFLEISVKQLVKQASFISLNETRNFSIFLVRQCVVGEKPNGNVVSSKVRYFLPSNSYSDASLIQFHLKGNNGSKSVSKRVVECHF